MYVDAPEWAFQTKVIAFDVVAVPFAGLESTGAAGWAKPEKKDAKTRNAYAGNTLFNCFRIKTRPLPKPSASTP